MPSIVQLNPADAAEKKLFVNDGKLPSSEIGRLIPSYPHESIEVLRSRYEEHGYLFMKGLMPRDHVLRCRENYFKLLSPSGVLKPGTKPVDGIFDSAKDRLEYPGVGAGTPLTSDEIYSEDTKDFVALAIQAHYKDFYTEDFCKHPALLSFVADLTQWGGHAMALKRTLLRNNTPGNNAIGVHYDQIFLRHGEPTALTAWVPIGDISIEGGGLIYLEGGDTLGQEIEAEFTRKAMESGLSAEQAKDAFNTNMMTTGFLSSFPGEFGRQHGRRWLLTEYEAGDVVFHKPHMIHASTINHDPEDRIRLGTDLRFVNTERPYDTRWTNYFRIDDGI